VTRGA